MAEKVTINKSMAIDTTAETVDPVQRREEIKSEADLRAGDYKGIFEGVSKALQQGPNVDEADVNTALNQLSTAFIDKYYELTGEFPTAKDVKKFVGAQVNESFASQYLQRQTSLEGVKESLASSFIQSNYSKKVKVEKTPEEVAAETKMTEENAKLQTLSEQQRTESARLFQEAIAALSAPIPTFSGAYTPEALDQLLSRLVAQGETAFQQTEAGAAAKGITGSTTEGFQLAATQQGITEAIANSTLDFLMRSGEAGQRNRELLATALSNQGQSLLTAGQQTQNLATTSGLSQQELALKAQQLQTQIAQFNAQFAESRRQFDQTAYQKTAEGLQNYDLFQKYLNRDSGSSGVTDALGLAFQGLGALGTVAGGVGGFMAGLKK